jgi:hypothetical protein
MVETYTGERALRSNNQSGFAMIEQKTTLKGMRTLTDTMVTLGQSSRLVPKGSTVFIREELFFQPGWSQKPFHADGVEGNFLIVDANFVEFINPLEEAVQERPGD